jgi:hypothetical protein
MEDRLQDSAETTRASKPHWLIASVQHSLVLWFKIIAACTMTNLASILSRVGAQLFRPLFTLAKFGNFSSLPLRLCAFARDRSELPLLTQHLVHEGNGDRAFAYGGRYALDVSTAHVSNRKYAGQAGLQEIRGPGKRPTGGGQIVV